MNTQFQINQNTPSSTPGIQLNREPLTVDHVKDGLKKGRLSAQLRQVTERVYPSGKAGNSLSDNLFPTAAFGFQNQSYKSTRMAWIDVPTGTTVEQVEEILRGCPAPGIQQLLSDSAILTDEQKSAIEAGLTTLAIIKYGSDGKGGQLVRYGDKNTEGKDPAAFIPGPNGGEQFRATFFKTNMNLPQNADQDLRLPKQVVAGTPAQPTQQESTQGLRSSIPSSFALTDQQPEVAAEVRERAL